MTRLASDKDLTDYQYQILEPLIPRAKSGGGLIIGLVTTED